MSIEEQYFSDVNLKDPFFNSLRADYEGFDEWFLSKNTYKAFVSRNEAGEIDGFLYLKVEDEALDDVTPSFPRMKRVKLGTFKIDAHGTKLGERFIRLMFQFAMKNRLKEIYVTIFDKHAGLIKLLERYGFELKARKNLMTINGQEGVYFRNLEWKE
ncbi:GNAT family N-acetyltransferase [Salmonella enterica]|nr:GNAT family N-acetyltransferase [Salmonella enterica]EDV4373939.1 GNAT family N-acetyltransferase [Salmonella enterica subsp. enterica]EHB9132731.1 GNAT family N-acetyltransferase [Salmonella enterica subsp. enterica serovar Curacao]